MIYLSSYQSSIPGLEKEFEAAKKEAFKQAALHWHDRMASTHFTLKAKTLYQYTPRRADYMKRKARFHKHGLPLIWSGVSKGMILSARRVAENRWGAQLHMMAPKYFYQYRPATSFINKVEELTAVTEGESKELGNVIDQLITSRLQAAPTQVVALAARA